MKAKEYFNKFFSCDVLFLSTEDVSVALKALINDFVTNEQKEINKLNLQRPDTLKRKLIEVNKKWLAVCDLYETKLRTDFPEFAYSENEKFTEHMSNLRLVFETCVKDAHGIDGLSTVSVESKNHRTTPVNSLLKNFTNPAHNHLDIMVLAAMIFSNQMNREQLYNDNSRF